MTQPGFQLCRLPRGMRIMLSAFVVVIGFGYLAALANMYQRHRHADGRPELTINDLTAAFHGLRVPAGARAVGPSGGSSRMAEQVKPGGKMRKHLEKGGDEAVRALETWLAAGAVQAAFDAADSPRPGDPSPRDVLEQQCMRCHNAEDGERKEDPFGPDSLQAEYAMLTPYVLVGAAASAAVTTNEAATRYIAPQATAHLVLVSHIHMLSIPVFTLLVAVLFYGANGSARWRGVLLPIPMLAMAADFASWWLAREFLAAVYVMLAAGAIFGAAFAMQLICVLWSLWSPPRKPQGTTIHPSHMQA